MKTFRVKRATLASNPGSRGELLQAVVFEDHGTRAIAAIGGEPLFELASLDEVLVAMKLTRDDVEER